MAHLFNHLVGAKQKRLWDLQAERFGSLEIDGQFELGRLDDGEIARLRALENTTGIDPRLTPSKCAISAITDQTAGSYSRKSMHCRNLVACRQRDDLVKEDGAKSWIDA